MSSFCTQGLEGILAALHAAEAAVDVHFLQVEAGNGMTGAFGSFGKGVAQHGRVALHAGTAVQNDDVLAHVFLLAAE